MTFQQRKLVPKQAPKFFSSAYDFFDGAQETDDFPSVGAEEVQGVESAPSSRGRSPRFLWDDSVKLWNYSTSSPVANYPEIL